MELCGFRRPNKLQSGLSSRHYNKQTVFRLAYRKGGIKRKRN